MRGECRKPVLRQKLKGGLFVSTSKDCEEDLAESFQLLPDDDIWNAASHPNNILSGGNEKKSPTEPYRGRGISQIWTIDHAQ